jgi:hypothetical protein
MGLDLRASVSVPVIARRLRVPELAVAFVTEHWLARRAARQLRPLLRRFHKPSLFEYLAARQATTHHRYTLARSLRYKFETVRMLSDMVRRREELKREAVQAAHSLFSHRVFAKHHALPAAAKAAAADLIPALRRGLDAMTVAPRLPAHVSAEASPPGSPAKSPPSRAPAGAAATRASGTSQAASNASRHKRVAVEEAAMLEPKRRSGHSDARGSGAAPANSSPPAGSSGSFFSMFSRLTSLWPWQS